ncbi:hypothetical protein HZS_1448, partial [Henneguya salminicola]
MDAIVDYAVKIDNITSMNGKVNILEDLSMILKQNKTYMLLGENGCGKSTLIKTIINIIQPKQGKVYLNRNTSSERSKLIGYCPQHDIIIDYLTVIEHFYFYWRIKTSTDPTDEKTTINKLVETMGFAHLKDSYAKNLSGGQKRKLSICIAFIGNPFLVILDEPTSGVDPESRRSIYELISNNKEGKTILITTHHMEETEILGDEFIMMASGKLLDTGTLLELKKKYGSTSKLIIEMSDMERNKKTVIDYVYLNCDCVLAHTIRNADIIFELKISYKFDKSMSKLFYGFKTNQVIFGIIMWAINDSSMEEIFINAFENKKGFVRDNEDLHNNNLSYSELNASSLIKLLKTKKKHPSFYSQTRLRISKIVKNTLRNKKFYLTQLFIPAICQILAGMIQTLAMYNVPSHLNINISETSKYIEMYLPIQHEKFNDTNQINNVFAEILNLKKGSRNYSMDKFINETLLSQFNKSNICMQAQHDICSFSNKSLTDILDIINNYYSFKYLKDNKITFQFIGDCDMSDFVIATDRIYLYQRYFSLKFNNEDNNGSTEIMLMNEHQIGEQISINYINNLIFKINARLQGRKNIENYAIEVISDSIKVEQLSGFQKTQFLIGLNQIPYWLSYYIMHM